MIASAGTTHQLQRYNRTALDVWVAPLATVVNAVCSARLFPKDTAILQPGAAIETPVCAFCAANAFDRSLLQPLAPVPLTPFCCSSAVYAAMGLALTHHTAPDGDTTVYAPNSPAGLFLQRLYYDAAVLSQPRQLPGNQVQEQQMVARIRSGCQTVSCVACDLAVDVLSV